MKSIIRFEKLIIENYASFYGKHDFTFSDTGIHRIFGHNYDFKENQTDDDQPLIHNNGSGKSQLTKSIDYAIYGNSPNKKINKDGLINKEAKKNMLVGLTFYKDGQKYEIMRYRKYSGKGDQLSFTRWDENDMEHDETLSDKNLTQEKINSVIGLNRETFIKTVLMSREGNRNFFELPAGERTSLIENIIRLDKFKEYTQKVKEKLAFAKKELNRIQTIYIETNSKFKTVNQFLKKEISMEKKRQREIAIEKQKLESENNLSIDDKTLENINQYINLYRDIIDKNRAMMASESGLKIAIENVKNIISYTFESRKRKTDLINSLSDKDHDLLCQHCGKDPDGRHKVHLTKIKKQIDELSQKTKLTKLKPSFKIVKELKEKIKTEKDLLLDLKEKIKQITLDKEIKNDIIENNGKSTLIDNIKIFIKRKEELEKQLSVKKDLSHYWQERTLSRAENKKAMVKKTSLEKEIQVGELWNTILDYRNDDSIKKFLLKKIVPVYNNILNAILDIVFQSKLTCTFNDIFEETIIYNGHEFDYEQLSTGEKAKLNIAINLAILNLMRINIGGANILFIDELFASIDMVSINKYLNILRESYPEIGIYVISHESGADLFQFDSDIIIERKDQRSKIVIQAL
jgi:DNA repair exonuclease SbcCD ATPase subunit